MKKQLILALALMMGFLPVKAQDEKKEEGFQFITIKEIPITAVRDQHRSSTCWAHSGLALMEAEALRIKGVDVDLSEMYVVSHSMMDRAEKYVRLHGNASWAPGGKCGDVLYCLEHYGFVRQEDMPGNRYGGTLPNHTELDLVATGYVKALAKSDISKLSPVWKEGLQGIYDAYLGKYPEKVNGMTPLEYAKSLGLEADNYITLTSFTHHPFYEPFALEIEDNWRGCPYYNLPIDELMEVMQYAIDKGYTFQWSADVSEQGFTRDGIAVCPDAEKAVELSGSDMAHWLGMSAANRRNELTSKPMPEIEVTQEMRQEAFDNWETGDDHGLLIFGKAKDQNGKEYFMGKNSWGDSGKYHGIWYVSETFAKYKTMNIVLHKDALPKNIAKKLGVK